MTPVPNYEINAYGSVEYFAGLIRDTVNVLKPASRFDQVDAATAGMLRSVLAGPGSDAEVRTWCRNALDAGEQVRIELGRMSGQRPGPLDGLVFDYVKTLLTEMGEPLTVQEIAERLDFPLEGVKRVVSRAHEVGRLVETDGRYELVSHRDATAKAHDQSVIENRPNPDGES